MCRCRRCKQSIRFEGISFAYADGLPPALDDVSFEIPAGRTTALVGASGAGKTTLIHLLLRLYAPGAGTIRIDGVPLQDLKRTDWLGLLAVAGQDVDLIEGTVLDNIRMADAEASQDDVLAAARMAGVDEFVDALPEGYETWIGQQGHRFSGGQRQRLGLARALLRKPQLLILDEAMNALDSALERRIRQAIADRFTEQHRADHQPPRRHRSPCRPGDSPAGRPRRRAAVRPAVSQACSGRCPPRMSPMRCRNQAMVRSTPSS